MNHLDDQGTHGLLLRLTNSSERMVAYNLHITVIRNLKRGKHDRLIELEFSEFDCQRLVRVLCCIAAFVTLS